jgi:flagellar hook-associated protein 2
MLIGKGNKPKFSRRTRNSKKQIAATPPQKKEREFPMTISVGGLVSGLDTNSIITQLMDLQKQPITKLQGKQADYNVELSTYGSLQSLMTQFKTDIKGLDSMEDLTSYYASSGNNDLFTAAANNTATVGSYDITVQQLASAQKLTSGGFSEEESVGEGTLHLKVGTAGATDINVSATDTLSDVAQKINDAKAGVKAAVVFDGTDYFLTLTAQKTGAANVINLTVTDTGDTINTDMIGLSRLVYDKGVTANLSNTADATDAIITVDGVTNIHRDTNIINDVIMGVTLNLESAPADPDNQATLTVSQDKTTLSSKINAFVTSYNELLSFFKTSQGYNAETKVAGTLMGDPTTNSIRNGLRRLFENKISGVGAFDKLSDLGIALNSSGKLEVNALTLNNAINNHFDNVQQFFTQSTEGSEGFAVRMVKSIDSMIGKDGTLVARTKGIQGSIEGLDTQIDRLTTQNAAVEARTRNQFNTLELLLSQYKTTGDYLSQQITGMQNLNAAIANQ